MLSLEVVGPGGSLSTKLIATPYGRDASWRVSWQAVTTTAASSATGRLQRSSIGWEAAGGGNGGADQLRRRRSLNLFILIRLVFVLYSAFLHYVSRLIFIFV
jgi:hypothetical protein